MTSEENTNIQNLKSSGDVSNQSRLRKKLPADSLAKCLASVYDPAHTSDEKRDALKQVVEDELGKTRGTLEHDKN